jgi:hypothetical protein
MNRTLRLEQMEERDLMTVAVAFSTTTGVLRITGSAASEQLEITGTGVIGQIRVREFVSTVAVERGTYTGVRSMLYNMGAGNDVVNAAAIAIPGSVRVLGGLGSDQFGLSDAPSESTEPDALVFIGGSLIVNLGGHRGDRMSWMCRASLGGTVAQNVTVTGVNSAYFLGGGSSQAMESADLNIGGKLTVLLSGPSNGSFGAYFGSVNAYGSTYIKGSAFADSTYISGSNFLSRVVLNLGAGNDDLNLNWGSANRFNSKFLVNFGTGSDSLRQRNDNYFALPMVTTGGPENIS